MGDKRPIDTGRSVLRSRQHIICGGRCVRRITASLALALCLLGCGSVVLPWDRVELLTSDGPNLCYTSETGGPLIVDRTNGTAIDSGDPTAPVPVMWPRGFSGRWAGSEVEVLDPDGTVVATTGRSYRIGGGSAGEDPRVWLACGWVIEQ
jgi:hypothetical protein